MYTLIEYFNLCMARNFIMMPALYYVMLHTAYNHIAATEKHLQACRRSGRGWGVQWAGGERVGAVLHRWLGASCLCCFIARLNKSARLGANHKYPLFSEPRAPPRAPAAIIILYYKQLLKLYWKHKVEQSDTNVNYKNINDTSDEIVILTWNRWLKTKELSQSSWDALQLVRWSCRLSYSPIDLFIYILKNVLLAMKFGRVLSTAKPVASVCVALYYSTKKPLVVLTRFVSLLK